jgi:hypothetical protein
MAHRPSSRLAHLKVPAPLDRGEISGDLTDFSSINGALRAVKGTKEGDESHANLTQHCGKSLVTAQFFIALLRLAHLEAPTPLHRGESSGDLTDFSSTNGALRAVKGTQEGDESHVDLTQSLSLQRA